MDMRVLLLVWRQRRLAWLKGFVAFAPPANECMVTEGGGGAGGAFMYLFISAIFEPRRAKNAWVYTRVSCRVWLLVRFAVSERLHGEGIDCLCAATEGLRGGKREGRGDKDGTLMCISALCSECINEEIEQSAGCVLVGAGGGGGGLEGGSTYRAWPWSARR